MPGLRAYATALAVDASGYLYVGYQSSPGVECADSGIYVFAPGAHGNSKPIRQIEMTGAMVYALSFDPRGRLVAGVGGTCNGDSGDDFATIDDPRGSATIVQALFGATFGQYPTQFFEPGTDICGLGATIDATGRPIVLTVPSCYVDGGGATVATYAPYAAAFAAPQRTIVLQTASTLRGAAQLAVDGNDLFVPLSDTSYKDIEVSGAYEFALDANGNAQPLDVVGFPEHGNVEVRGVAVGP